MKPLTAEDRDTFIDAVRAGSDRGEAARLINRSGTQLKRMMNPDGQTYDQELHSEYLSAIADRDQAAYRAQARDVKADTPTTNANGHVKAAHLTDDALDRFLEEISAGVPRDLAARNIGTSLLQIKRRATTHPDFAQRLAAAYEEGYPHYQDWLRSKVVEYIESGSYPALRDQVMIHLPEADKLRTSKHEIGGPGGGPIKLLQAVLSEHVPAELLDQVIRQVKDAEAQKALQPPVVDQ